jgi:hypothetical protein
MPTTIQPIDEEVKAFKRGGSVEDLEAAFKHLGLIQVSAIGQKVDVNLRKEKVIELFRVVAAIEGSIDSRFDPSDAPALNVTPPAEADVPAGADPAAIKDSALRSEYQRAIDANNVKSKYFNRQYRARLFYTSLEAIVPAFLAEDYKPLSSQTASEVRSLAHLAGVSTRFADSVTARLH